MFCLQKSTSFLRQYAPVNILRTNAQLPEKSLKTFLIDGSGRILTVYAPWPTFSPGVGCQSLLVEILYVSELSPPNKSSQILHGGSVLKPRYYIQMRSHLSYVDLHKLKISSLQKNI